jgi:hypothetical protein
VEALGPPAQTKWAKSLFDHQGLRIGHSLGCRKTVKHVSNPLRHDFGSSAQEQHLGQEDMPFLLVLSPWEGASLPSEPLPEQAPSCQASVSMASDNRLGTCHFHILASDERLFQ